MLKKFIISFILIVSFCVNLLGNDEDLKNTQKLLDSYPNFLKSYNENEFTWYDNSITLYDDKKTKNSYKELLDNPSLKEQMSIKYPQVLENENYILKENEDAGRVRNEEFFKKIYGKNEKEIRKNIVKIVWMPKSINKILWVTKINGVDNKLEKISNELELLPNEMKKYLKNVGGFNFRKISNSNNLSSHAYGIAIDIDIKNANYWQWDRKKIEHKNKIPLEIVKIFEKYGFIWGGRWYHYDTMHFEYRPELF